MRLTLQVPAWATALASDLTDMDRDPQPVAPGETVEYELPDDVYFQYAFVDEDGKLRPDPAGAEKVASVWYGEVSVVKGPDYQRSELAEVANEPERGKTDRLRLEPVAGEGPPWRVTVFTPATAAGAEASELPLVIAQDGVAFFRIGKAHLIAGVLAERGEARPARFAFIEPHDRDREYGFAEDQHEASHEAHLDAYQRFLAERLEPELSARYPSTPERIYLGGSLGALASARAAIGRTRRDPGLAGATTVLSFSGAFLGAPGDPDYYRSTRSWLLDMVRDPAVTVPARWYLEVGTLEWLLAVNRDIAAALASRPGVTATLTERSAGHNWTSWRNGLADGLRFALAPDAPAHDAQASDAPAASTPARDAPATNTKEVL